MEEIKKLIVRSIMLEIEDRTYIKEEDIIVTLQNTRLEIKIYINDAWKVLFDMQYRDIHNIFKTIESQIDYLLGINNG